VTSLQEQARALGDPTRHAVFRFVAEAEAPVGVAEITAHFGLNHNAIRQHLAKLVAAGLVVEGTAPVAGRGRPRLLYEVDPGAESRWGVAGPYERLAGWLAEIVRTGDTPREVGRRVGRRQAEATPGGDRGDPMAELVDQMARHGFEPELDTDGAAVDVTLLACPFASTALDDPTTVCELHLGIAEGIAGAVPGLAIDELVARDPRRAHCRLRAHVEPVAASPSAASPTPSARLVGRGAPPAARRARSRPPT
jgi:predicted ArsR family transcriptional regulator